jgi:hypothetical protein
MWVVFNTDVPSLEGGGALAAARAFVPTMSKEGERREEGKKTIILARSPPRNKKWREIRARDPAAHPAPYDPAEALGPAALLNRSFNTAMARSAGTSPDSLS